VLASLILREYLSSAAGDPALFETHEEFISRHDALQSLTPDAGLPHKPAFPASPHSNTPRNHRTPSHRISSRTPALCSKPSTRIHGMSAFMEHFRLAQPGWLLLLLRHPAAPSCAADAVRTPPSFFDLSVLVSLGKTRRHTAGSLGLPLAFLSSSSPSFATWPDARLANEFQSRTAAALIS